MQLPKPKYEVAADNHRYSILIGGKKIGPLNGVTSVTGILDKPALLNWAAKEAAAFFKAEILRIGPRALNPAMLDQIALDAAKAHRKKKEAAADLGTACHDIFEAIIKGKEPENIPEELKAPAEEFKAWRLKSDIEIVGTEIAVASMEFMFGGRLDAVGYCEKRGGWGIVDYKTSSGFYGNEFAYQVGGYGQAFSEMYGVSVKWAEVVRFSKKPPYQSEAKPVTDLPRAIEAFVTLNRVKSMNAVKMLGASTFISNGKSNGNGVAKTIGKVKTPSTLGF